MWVIRSEHKLINFLHVVVLDAFPANSEDPNVKNFQREQAPGPP